MLPEAAEFPLPGRLDLGLTLGVLRRGGSRDRTIRIEPDRVWRASWTPAGAATLRLEVAAGCLRARAWGPGAGWAVLAAPALVGLDDDPGAFQPAHPLLSTIHRQHTGLRLGRTGAVFEALVPTILEQKVPGVEAWSAYAAMVSALGEPAPGEGRLLLPPTPRRLLATPYWAYHRFGIERRKADVIRNAAALAGRLNDLVQLEPVEARRRLLGLPGIGPWSAAEVAAVALGDRDAVSVGDYNLPHVVSWALAGEPRGSDARMLELLEPYRGHRTRVIRLLAVAGICAPRFGPRLPLRRFAGR
ncbi:MAG: DNA-3-methyladenine glycosylase 2 family protein [Candidatus Dormibacteraeota bacterium]|nr:DNA-3-methyladenine glycosylase 2 family protein [Candidatus Dormibacteraeota bacterium]